MGRMNTDRCVAHLAQSQHGVVTRRQALEQGLSPRVIDLRLQAGQWEPIHRGVFRLAGSDPGWPQPAMAACLAAGGDAVASYRSAAALHNLPGMARWVEITVPPDKRVRVPGVTVHRSRLCLPGDRMEVLGIPVTSPARTVVDLAGILPVARMRPVLDHALGERLVRRRELEELIGTLRRRGRPGLGNLDKLLQERPDSARPMQAGIEALLYRTLARYGVPLPVAQYRILLPDGRQLFVDFAYPDLGLALEADSRRWHDTSGGRERDYKRYGELVAEGWSVLPVAYWGLKADPAGTARRIQRALEARQGLWSARLSPHA
jgi:hypothetical protein